MKKHGFTLIEVTLALTIGSALVAAVILLYSGVRQNAGYAAAQRKVVLLQQIVDELAQQRNGQYPTIGELRGAWAKKAPDFDRSPWGGTAFGGQFGIEGGDRAPGDYSTEAVESSNTGILYYYRQSDPVGSMVFRDLARGSTDASTGLTSVRFYMVASGNDRGDRYYYVRGPAASDPAALEGEVGK